MSYEQEIVRIREILLPKAEESGELRKVRELRIKEADNFNQKFTDLEKSIDGIKFQIENHAIYYATPNSNRETTLSLLRSKVTAAIKICEEGFGLRRLMRTPNTHRFNLFLDIIHMLKDKLVEFKSRLLHVDLTGTVVQTRNWFIDNIDTPFAQGLVDLKRIINEEDERDNVI